ncbi:MAG: YggS family pyridoxal phosphate-dependent enzyme [Bdellovibrionia bacterium]
MAGSSIAENIKKIGEKIERSAKKSGRTRDAVRIIAVSKTKPVAMIREAMAAGQHDFGENYVQELVPKIDELSSERWHYIGSLQRNKCKLIVGRAELIHSVDRVELAREISKIAESLGRKQAILVQIKIGDEESKSGAPIETAEGVLAEIVKLPGLAVKGLMTFPPLFENPEDARSDFKSLAEFQREMKKKLGLSGFDDLSMGSSHDYEVAVEEGATLVRIGTEIFGRRSEA